jgi:hypothetical protein
LPECRLPHVAGSKSSPSSGDKGDGADKGKPESAEVETASTSGKGDCAGNRRSSGLGKMEPIEDKSRWTGWKPPLKLAIPWGGCVKKVCVLYETPLTSHDGGNGCGAAEVGRME